MTGPAFRYFARRFQASADTARYAPYGQTSSKINEL